MRSYGSLPQKDADGKRSETEQAAFSSALATMGSWYANKWATTFSMTQLPAGWDATPYSERGWCTFERAVSELVKESETISWRKLADPSIVRKVSNATGAYRSAPEPPEAFAARLARKTFTNGKSDCELVATLYADTLAAALGETPYLLYMNCAWGDDEVEKLAAVLSFTRRVLELDLCGNPRIGRRGYAALAAALRDARAAPRLREIWVDYPKGPSATELRAACEARGIALRFVPLV